MPAEVVDFPGSTAADLPPDKVLTAAVGQLHSVVVVGVDADGKLYVAASDGQHELAVTLLARAHRYLLSFYEEDG